ncbi:MAG TPA: methyltransferase domain-containing protein [Ktedonobacteraceae bacterium]|nr:methyltransferase domain-containing protein [Ktedonobacteraceae bacterium]
MMFFNRLFHRKSRMPAILVSSPGAENEIVDDRRRLTDAPYFLPKDEEEDGRLFLQHKALYAAMGNHYLAPIRPDIANILDVGTGTGVWPVDMSRLFPQAHIVGMDISSLSFRYSSSSACTFLCGNVLTGLPFPDQQFDFVHQRLLVAGIPTANWPGVIRELVRVTRPGGWVELLEVGITVKNAGPETTRLLTWMANRSRERGFDLGILPELGDLLVHAGLQAVETQNIPAPLGEWAGRVGAMLKTDVLSAFHAVKGVYCTQANLPPDQFDAWVKIVAEEWEQRRASYVFHAAYGKRAPTK